MSETSINISLRSLLWFFALMLLIFLLIIIFSSIDSSKKYREFKSLNQKILASEYPDRLDSLLRKFSRTDTVLLKTIKDNLSLLEQDFPEVNYSEIYIKDSCCYYNITGYPDYHTSKLVDEIKFLQNDIKRYFLYLDQHPNPNIDSFYTLMTTDSNLELVFKLSNCYLRITVRRK